LQEVDSSVTLATKLILGGVLLVVGAACQPSNPSRPQSAAESPAAGSSPAPAPAKSPSPEPAHPVSLPALMNKTFDGRDLTVGRVLTRPGPYTRYFVTYKSGSLTVSGIMNVPAGNGPFPALVLNHGYIDPDIYTNGRGMAREQDFLARRGYVVLHTDYRNHAQSDDDPNADLNLRLGYTEDTINAVLAIQRSGLPYIDGDRVGMVGRSMGGGVTLNALVVKPDLVRAAVIFAPVSSDTVDNFNKWIRGERGAERRELAERVIALYGSPEANPPFWRNISPVNFFDRIAAPLVIHHGTADESVPIDWSHKTLAALQKHNKRVEFFIYEGEHHAFVPQWPTSMNRSVDFLDQHIKN
jgi:dipeptidyl aminopeptidase/acylaminoacyl peptidase